MFLPSVLKYVRDDDSRNSQKAKFSASAPQSPDWPNNGTDRPAVHMIRQNRTSACDDSGGCGKGFESRSDASGLAGG